MGLNLGQDWEFQPDAPNNRLFAEYGPTGSSVSFGEDGDLTLDDGNLDLSGGSLTDSSQDYVDLSGGGNDLRLATGQAIEDGGGTARFSLNVANTVIRDESGEPAFVADKSNKTELSGYSGQPVTIEDREGGFTAIQYDTSASAPGTLELTNANLDAGGNDITNVGSVSTDELSNNSYWISAGAMGSASGLSLQSVANEGSYWAFPDGATNDVMFGIPAIEVFGGGTYDVYLYWFSSDTNGDDAVFSAEIVGISEGTALSDSATSATLTDNATADALNIDQDAGWSATISKNDLTLCKIRRSGGAGADTLAADANVLGVEFRRT